MRGTGRTIRTFLAAFGLLFAVSLYRQISLRLTPGDPFRTWVLFAVYALLLFSWGVSLWIRVTQRTMRLCLLAECGCMLAALFLRFLQDTFWTADLRLLRTSGLFVAAFLFPLMLLGLYAALGLGQSDDWRLPAPWKCLALPVLFLDWLLVTDERHHFYFHVLPGEAQPNLIFRPAPGFFLAFALGLVLAILRVLVIFRRNRSTAGSTIRRILTAMAEPLVLVLVTLPFLLVSLGLAPFLAGKEILELFAKVFCVEILTWEMYIALGLVPVNTHYRDIFEHSTAAMQIIRADGSRIRSVGAPDCTPRQLEELRRSGVLDAGDGRELHLQSIPGGEFLWIRDTARQHALLQELERTAEHLSQENLLLQEELRSKNRETSITLKNQIYNQLAEEVRPQLARMKDLLQRIRRSQKDADAGELRTDLLRLCLLGSFLKRHCHLRLLWQEQGRIAPADLEDGLRELARILQQGGCTCDFCLDTLETPDPREALEQFDALEALLEQRDFFPERLVLRAEGPRLLMQAEGSAKGGEGL